MATMTKDISAATRDVAKAVLKDGVLDAVGTVEPGVLDMEQGSLKEALRHSLLLMKDGSYAVVPGRRAVVERSGKIYVSVRDGDGAAQERDNDWLDSNVKTAWLVILSGEGNAGAQAKLRYNGLAASVAPVFATPIAKLAVSADGGQPVEKGIAEALDMLGLSGNGRAWQGGEAELQFRTGLPGATAVAAYTLSTQALVGGGTWALSRAAKLGGLGIALDPTGTVEGPVAAELVAAWAGERRLAPALATAFAIPPAQAGEQAARDAALVLRASVGEAIDAISPERLRAMAAQVAKMRTDGMWPSDAVLGSLLHGEAQRGDARDAAVFSSHSSSIITVEWRV